MNKIIFGDVLQVLDELKSQNIKVQTCITSPPYYQLRSYLPEEDDNKSLEIGNEKTPDEYIDKLVEVFRGIKDILEDDGTLWINIGDSYAGSGKGQWDGASKDPKNNKTNGMKLEVQKASDIGLKPKDLIGIPWKLAFALQKDGWWLRQDIIWHKPNCLPEPVKDRCVKSHEYIFLLSKSKNYYFDYEAIQEPLVENSDVAYRNKLRKNKKYNSKEAYETNFPASFNEDSKRKRSVWSVNTKPYTGSHCAVYPPELIEPCVIAGSRIGDIVFDPFMGSGTTAEVAILNNRQYLGIDLDIRNKELQNERINKASHVVEELKEVKESAIF